MMVVVAVLGAVTVIASPKIAGFFVKTKSTQCGVTRAIVERAEERYRFEHSGLPSASLDELRQTLYIDRVPKCSAGGQYIWISTANPVSMGCSVHNWPYTPAPPLTPLGSTFSEITGNLVSLTQSFFDAAGKWPRSFGDYRYTDIGLDPADWSGVAYDGVVYGAGGNRISIKSGSGWQISVTGLDGVNRVLNPSWNIWYDMATAQWYYHDITPSEKIDIGTLKVKQL